MQKLGEEATQRIAEKRRQAEAELKGQVSTIKTLDKVEPYIEACAIFAKSLFDAYAEEFLSACQNSSEFEPLISQDLATAIVEQILPDESLQTSLSGIDEKIGEYSVVSEVDSPNVYVETPDGTRAPAPASIRSALSAHGIIEQFIPPEIAKGARSRDNARFRETLSQTLKRAAPYWIGQLPFRQFGSPKEVETERQVGPDCAGTLMGNAGGSRNSAKQNFTRTSFIVQEWERVKAGRDFADQGYKRIPESVLRRVLANRHGVDVDDIPWEDIWNAALDLCRHYGRFQLVPNRKQSVACEDVITPVADAPFWREREEEFRRHDEPPNSTLGVTWFPHGVWRFHSGPGLADTEALQLFKSLAREAAKGLAGNGSVESWTRWLDLLRRADNPDTGSPLHAQIFPTSSTDSLTRRKLEEMVSEGSTPHESFIEFDEVSSEFDEEHFKEYIIDLGRGKLRSWLCSKSSNAKIENLLKKSTNFCVALRSLTPASSFGRKDADAVSRSESGAPFTLPVSDAPLVGGTSGEPPPDCSSSSFNPVSADRSARVRDFVSRCNQEPNLGQRIFENHIWKAIGHRQARQFQHWKKERTRSKGETHGATLEDNKNFERILASKPADFVALLRQMELIR